MIHLTLLFCQVGKDWPYLSAEILHLAPLCGPPMHRTSVMRKALLNETIWDNTIDILRGVNCEKTSGAEPFLRSVKSLCVLGRYSNRSLWAPICDCSVYKIQHLLLVLRKHSLGSCYATIESYLISAINLFYNAKWLFNTWNRVIFSCHTFHSLQCIV